jgi:F0F1-type ATP synthase assembly protein I
MININLDQESAPTKKNRDGKTSYTDLGVIFGAGLGTLLGVLIFENTFFVGIIISIVIGLILGIILDAHAIDN